MSEARAILKECIAVTSRYRAELIVFEVPKNEKFPQGIKAKFVLVDAEGGFARLLVDNHEPFGFHMHTHLPKDKTIRLELSVKDHDEALEVFFREVERIVANEQK